MFLSATCVAQDSGEESKLVVDLVAERENATRGTSRQLCLLYSACTLVEVNVLRWAMTLNR